MDKPYRRLLCFVAFLSAGIVFAQSEDTLPAKGKIAILPNDRIMEGDIERVGDQYRIRRATGETWLTADKVRRLCDNLDEAYAYLRVQANLQDPDERLRLARWCLGNGLRPQALEEATAAVKMRPNHAESQRLMHAMQRSLAAGTAPVGEAKTEPATEATSVPQSPYNPASLGLFVTKVQPILMNTCASCHASGKGGEFKLLRVYEEGTSTGRATQHNLMAALAQLDRRDPAHSPLLGKATMIHYPGADQPPIRDRNPPAFRTLEDWVTLAVADLPKPTISSAKPQAAVAPAADANPQAIHLPADARPTEEAPAPTGQFANPPPVEETSPPASDEPADEFDAMIFNRQMHQKN